MKTSIDRHNPWLFFDAELFDRLIPSTCLNKILVAAEQEFAARPALTFYTDGMKIAHWTYTELIGDVRGIAAELVALGIKRGDRIIVLSGNCPEVYMTYLAVIFIGAIAVPVSPVESKDVLSSIVNQVEPSLIIEGTDMDRSLMDVGGEIRKIDAFGLLRAGRLRSRSSMTFTGDADDVAVILFTSGTTSQPKGVLLSHYNLLVNAEGLRRAHALDKYHKHLCVLPLFHANAFGFSMISSVYSGCHVVLASRTVGPMLWKVIEQEKINVLSAVPELLQTLALRRHNPSLCGNLRYVVSAAAPLSKTVAQTFEVNTGVPIHQGYGLSECVNFAATMPHNISSETRASLMYDWAVPSIGCALFGNEITVLNGDGCSAMAGEEGEILVSGHNVMKGYWGAPAETAKVLRNGWLHTGDLGFYTEIDGIRYYFISGRLKEIIIRCGESLSPLVIEKELAALKEFGRFAVCGFRNKAVGEEIGIYVQGTLSDSDLERLSSILMACSPRYRPRAVIFGSGDIPATVTGKIQRRRLAQQFAKYASVSFSGTPKIFATSPICD